MKIRVAIQCNRCWHIAKLYDYSGQYIFLPVTLKSYAEQACEECGHVGLEMSITLLEEEQPESEQASA